MPRRGRGWKVWVEKSGLRWRCRWEGKYGNSQQIFDFADDALELEIKKRRSFQRADAGLEEVASHTPPDYPKFKARHVSWLEQRRSHSTVRNCKRALRLWEGFAGAVFPSPRRSEGKGASDFSDWLLKKYSANGSRIVLRHAKAAFRWARREGHIDYDPFDGFEMPARVKVARVLKPGELLQILRALQEDCRNFLYFILHTGLRISEGLSLTWDNVVEHDGATYLTVKKAKTRRAQEEYKSQAIHPNAVSAMGPKSSGAVFKISQWKLQWQLRSRVKKLGLGRVRWHDLRHTWATHFLQDVRDLKALMDAGGWTTLQAAMEYQHSTPNRVKSTLEYRSPVRPDEI